AVLLQFLLQSFRAIAITTRPGFRTVFVPAMLAVMRILDVEQLEVFLPVRPLLRQRRGAETSFHPARDAIIANTGLLQVVLIFIAGDRTSSQRAVRDGFQQGFFTSGFDSSFDQITHGLW